MKIVGSHAEHKRITRAEITQEAMNKLVAEAVSAALGRGPLAPSYHVIIGKSALNSVGGWCWEIRLEENLASFPDAAE